MSLEDLTGPERRQLRILKAVADDPSITGTWRHGECERLVDLGYAARHEVYPDIWIAHITPEGIAALENLPL